MEIPRGDREPGLGSLNYGFVLGAQRNNGRKSSGDRPAVLGGSLLAAALLTDGQRSHGKGSAIAPAFEPQLSDARLLEEVGLQLIHQIHRTLVTRALVAG